MTKAIIVQGLGFGDEGKGATCDFLARRYNVSAVVRFCGGAQAGHSVVTPDGRTHIFSQFGAASFLEVPTYLSEYVMVDPIALQDEAKHLVAAGVVNPYRLLSIDSRCLVLTHYHRALNRLREISRCRSVDGVVCNQRHGSCGAGIGEAREYWLKWGQDAVVVNDLFNLERLRSKLELMRQRALIELQTFIYGIDPADLDWLGTVFNLPASVLARDLVDASKPIQRRELNDRMFTGESIVVFEGAQGALLDEWYGFHPYTTWNTVTAHHARELIQFMGIREVCTLGVTRTFTTRHGAGPQPTYDKALTQRMQDGHNTTNDLQGNFNWGHLDAVLLRYARKVLGMPLDGLAVTWLDAGDRYRVATSYGAAQIPVADVPNLAHQRRLCHTLFSAEPVYTDMATSELLEFLSEIIAPVVITSTGPKGPDRRMPQELPFRDINSIEARSCYVPKLTVRG